MRLSKAHRAELIRRVRADIAWKCANCDRVIGKGRLLCTECGKLLRKIGTINTNA
jgi:hypothetical protein